MLLACSSNILFDRVWRHSTGRKAEGGGEGDCTRTPGVGDSHSTSWDENIDVAHDMRGLADVLGYFNDVDDEEVLRLYEQTIAITSRLEGSSTMNIAVGEQNLGNAYRSRADRALAANDLDRCIANLELALPHYREAARIFRVINLVEKADQALRSVAIIEEEIKKVRITIAVAAVATKG